MKNFSILLLIFPSLLFSKPTEQLLTPLQIPAVLIGDPGNKPDSASKASESGSVKKNFLIGKYEITAYQYCSFLNAVATHDDQHHLYKKEMTEDPQVACIRRTELPNGTFSYDPIDQREKLPITYVTLHDAQRFCNWLENNCPTTETDPELLAASTESGAYLIIQKNGEEFVTFNPDAHFWIPTENEWIKAAYYKGNGLNSGYWSYPTQHDAAPNNGHGDPTNHANYETMASHWNPSQQNPVLTPVDYFSKTCSFYGAHDMGGNAAEWTCDLHEENNKNQVIVRGGSWKSQYSIWWNNELMRTAVQPSYDSLTANNFIGFRIAATAEEALCDQNEIVDSWYSNHSNAESYILWTAARGLFVGCPRMMVSSVAKFFGYDAASLLGVSSISSNSIQVFGAIFLVDLAGYISVIAALTAASYLIPEAWSWIRSEFFESHAQKDKLNHDEESIHFTFTDIMQSAMKALFGCGICQLNFLFTTLKTLLSTVDMDSSLLTTMEDSILELQLAEIPYVPSWIVYNSVPVLIELGLFLVALEVCEKAYYYWPPLQDTLLQFWYSI